MWKWIVIGGGLLLGAAGVYGSQHYRPVAERTEIEFALAADPILAHYPLRVTETRELACPTQPDANCGTYSPAPIELTETSRPSVGSVTTRHGSSQRSEPFGTPTNSADVALATLTPASLDPDVLPTSGIELIFSDERGSSVHPPVEQEHTKTVLKRLPPVVEVAASEPAYDVVQFAAGAIELSIPRSWIARELPAGRTVRLVIAPKWPEDPRAMPQDYLWISYHARMSGAPSSDLAAEVQQRLRQVTADRAQWEQVQPLQIDSWPAAAIRFYLPAATMPAAPPRHGRHVLVDTDWGVCELHLIAHSDDSVRLAEFEQLLGTLKINSPQMRVEAPSASTHDAERILGAWKAYRSRLRLSGSGRIEITGDASGTGEAAPLLTGHYVAERDLILVTWDDGSRLNFRWRLHEDGLLLTDHQGRTSHLRRLLE